MATVKELTMGCGAPVKTVKVRSIGEIKGHILAGRPIHIKGEVDKEQVRACLDKLINMSSGNKTEEEMYLKARNVCFPPTARDKVEPKTAPKAERKAAPKAEHKAAPKAEHKAAPKADVKSKAPVKSTGKIKNK